MFKTYEDYEWEWGGFIDRMVRDMGRTPLLDEIAKEATDLMARGSVARDEELRAAGLLDV